MRNSCFSRKVLIGAMLVALTGGCRHKSAQQSQPPVPAVIVSRPIVHEVMDWDGYDGQLSSPETVEVRPRVGGLITEAPFVEGAIVKEGEVLFVVDPRPYAADLASAKANVAKAEAALAQTAVQLRRTAEALKLHAVSAEDYDTAKANQLQAQAQLEAAQAAQQTSELNLEWTNVLAPISGRVGQKLIVPGNLVTGGGSTASLLTTIVSLDPIYCYINVDEHSVLKYMRLVREGKLMSARKTRVPAFLRLANETGFPHAGFIDFVNNQIDPATGTIRVRAVFPNTGDRLLPGFSAVVRVPGSGKYDAIMVPDSAIVTLQNERLLYVIGPDNVVKAHPVTLGTLFGQLRVISSGITPDDVVIINGLLRAQPGGKVTPMLKQIPASAFPASELVFPTTQQLQGPPSIPSTRASTAPAGGPTTR